MVVTVSEPCPVCAALKSTIKERTLWHQWHHKKVTCCDECEPVQKAALEDSVKQSTDWGC